MLYNLTKKVKRLSSPKSLLALAFLFVLMYMLTIGEPFGAAEFNERFPGLTPLDMRDSYTVQDVCTFMEKLGDTGRMLYARMILMLDFAFPLAYSLFWSAVIAFFLGKFFPCDSKLMYISLIPFAAGLADWLENLLILSMLFSYPRITAMVAALANLLTNAKALLMWVSLLLMVIGLFMYLVRLAVKQISR